MTISNDKKLNSDAIRSKIKNLSPRLLYVLMKEVSLDKSQSTSIIDVDYLTRRLIELNITSEDLDRYIDIAHDNVLDDKAVDWIFKSLRVVLWFDDYLEKNKSKVLSPYILEFKPIVRTTYIDDCLKVFDTCYLSTEKERNNIADDQPMNNDIYLRSRTKLGEILASLISEDSDDQPMNNDIYLRSRTRLGEILASLISENTDSSVRLTHDTNITSNSQNPTLPVNKPIQQFERKSEFINCAKAKYNSCRTPKKHTDWLDVQNEQQILWAQEHLYSQNLLIQPKGFLTNSLQNVYDQVCASLDAIDTGSGYNSTTYETPGMSLEKKEIIRKIRGAWSQKKFRDKKDAESALEYILNRQHINKLKKLADDDEVSSAEYLRKLIDKAFDKTE